MKLKHITTNKITESENDDTIKRLIDSGEWIEDTSETIVIPKLIEVTKQKKDTNNK